MESTAILWYFYFSNQRLVANAGLGLAALKMAEPVHSWPLTHNAAEIRLYICTKLADAVALDAKGPIQIGVSVGGRQEAPFFALLVQYVPGQCVTNQLLCAAHDGKVKHQARFDSVPSMGASLAQASKVGL
jgi:hypothetical protein